MNEKQSLFCESGGMCNDLHIAGFSNFLTSPTFKKKKFGLIPFVNFTQKIAALVPFEFPKLETHGLVVKAEDSTKKSYPLTIYW